MSRSPTALTCVWTVLQYCQLSVVSLWVAFLAINPGNIASRLLMHVTHSSFRFELTTNIAIVFCAVLLIIVAIIVYFADLYCNNDSYYTWFGCAFFVFVLSMLGLIIAESPFVVMLSWDLLGVSSFLLVYFYMTAKVSEPGSLITIITNRIGDFFLFLFVANLLFSADFWSELTSWFSLTALFFTAITKSAITPFSGWLPKAIAAPTPVSALVHRSTLVTAGLVVLIRFRTDIFTTEFNVAIIILGIITMVWASVRAIIEPDLKETVAYSTLSQLGLIFIVVGLGYHTLALVHILVHAVFKSLLFIEVGNVITSWYGSQHVSDLSQRSSWVVILQVIITVYNLFGLFFFSGMVTKDLIVSVSSVQRFALFVVLLLYIGIALTLVYRFRIIQSLFILAGYYFSAPIVHNMMHLLTLFLVSMSMWFGSWSFSAVFGSYPGLLLIDVFFLVWFLFMLAQLNVSVIGSQRLDATSSQLWYFSSLLPVYYRMDALQHMLTLRFFGLLYVSLPARFFIVSGIRVFIVVAVIFGTVMAIGSQLSTHDHNSAPTVWLASGSYLYCIASSRQAHNSTTLQETTAQQLRRT